MADRLPAGPLHEAAEEPLLTITPLADPVGLCLDGEADLSAAHLIRQALAGLPADASAIHLELAGLRFIDVVCSRELMAIRTQRPNARLILHSAPPTLRSMIRLLWPESKVEFARPPG